MNHHETTDWISLTFDDALPQHLDVVVPALNAAGLRGTFYTHLSAPAFVSRQPDWRRAAFDGHELGNHTIFHPADARKPWVRPGNSIDTYCLDRMTLELEVANAFLFELDGQHERTFAYPCCNSSVGKRGVVRQTIEALGFGNTRLAGWIDRFHMDFGSTRRSYEPVIARQFLAGRGGGLLPGQLAPATSLWRRSQLPSVAIADWSLQALQAYVFNSLAARTWAILQFHGIGGGHHMDCPAPVFRDFVAWLSNDFSGNVITVAEGARRLWRKTPSPETPQLENANSSGAYEWNQSTAEGNARR